VRALVELFADGGSALLSQAGLAPGWDAALAHVPPEVLGVPPGLHTGLRQLLALRDFWSMRGDLQPALAASRALVELLGERAGSAHVDTLIQLGVLGVLAARAGRQEEGSTFVERALAQLDVAPDDVRRALVCEYAARVRVLGGDRAGAVAALREAHTIRVRVAPQTADHAGAQLAELLVADGDRAAAVPLFEAAVAAAAARDGARHARTLGRSQHLGAAYNALGRHAEAVVVLRPVVASLPASERRASVAFELGLALHRTGGAAEAARLIEESVRWSRAMQPPDGPPHRALSGRLALWAHLQAAAGRPALAEGLLMEALEAARRVFGEDSAQVAERTAGIGHLLAQAGRHQEAIGWLEPACSLLRSTAGDADVRTVSAVEALGEAVLACVQGRADVAGVAQMVRGAHRHAGAVLGHAHRVTRGLRDAAPKR